MPNVFFSALLPKIDDPAELKVTLQTFFVLARQRGYPKFVVYRQISADRDFMAGLRHLPEGPLASLRRGFDLAVERGTLLRLVVEWNGHEEELFLLNTESNRGALDKIIAGQLTLQPSVAPVAGLPVLEQPNIFALYEQNIGMLTPLIADELKDAEKSYPAPWIEDAFREAVASNKRSWRYVQAILERWATNGKQDAKSRGHSKAKTDPESYFRGEFGHLIKG